MGWDEKKYGWDPSSRLLEISWCTRDRPYLRPPQERFKPLGLAKRRRQCPALARAAAASSAAAEARRAFQGPKGGADLGTSKGNRSNGKEPHRTSPHRLDNATRRTDPIRQAPTAALHRAPSSLPLSREGDEHLGRGKAVHPLQRHHQRRQRRTA